MDYLAHHGILGQKWGIRRYQNPDGSLTPEGRERYGRGDGRRFKSDALKDVRYSRAHGGREAWEKSVNNWAKIADESGLFNRLTLDDISDDIDERMDLFDIYSRSQTGKNAMNEQNKVLAKDYTKQADRWKKENIDELDSELRNGYPELHKELGTKSGVDTRQYLIDSMKGFNEDDPYRTVEERMDAAPMLYREGRISEDTYNKIYDASAAKEAVWWLNQGSTAESFKYYHDKYENSQKSVEHGYYNSNQLDELYHHGIKGQKWGTRRWQNEDGSLTPEGYPHYGYNGPRDNSLERAYQGLKAGAIYGATQGAIATAFAMSVAAAAGPISIPFYLNAGASMIASEAFRGAIVGASVGRVYGAAETAIGKASVLAANTELGKIKLSNLKRK